MGNHSDTGELLEEARLSAITGSNADLDTLTDEFGNAIKLNQSPEELQPANPTKLKDSSGRDIDLIQTKADPNLLTPKQLEALEAKRKKKKSS